MSELDQVYKDLIYLAKRQRIIEDAVIGIETALVKLEKDISEWTEFMNTELFRQGITIHKNKKSFEYFRSTLRETHKQNYEKMESLYKRVNSLFDKKGKGRWLG